MAARNRDWAGEITQAWHKTRDGVIEVGQLIIDAKESPTLPHGEFMKMIKNELPFSERSAQMLMKVAGDERLLNTNHGSLLPPSWRTLHEITKLNDEQFDRALDEGIINPNMKRADVSHFLKAERRKKKHQDAGQEKNPNPGRHVLLYADPPWVFDTFSEKGKDLAPDQHYQTMSDDEIIDHHIGDKWMGDMAADDAILFMWGTPANLERALAVMDGWGFEYKSHMVWVKDKAGMGFYPRQMHEPLLIGTKGEPLTPIWVPPSVIHAPRGKHSEKPDEFRDALEKMYPYWKKKNRAEIFAREKTTGWTCYGNEI